MRILLADSDTAATHWTTHLLSGVRGHELVGTITDVRHLATECRRTHSHAVIISGPHFIEHLAALDEVAATAAVIVIWSATSGSSIWTSLDHGVSAEVMRDRLADELGPALATIEAGGVYISPTLARQLVDYLHERIGGSGTEMTIPEIRRHLLPREREVLHRLSAGQSTDEIAGEMNVTASTVRAYVSRMLRKLRMRSRSELVGLAYRSGFYLPSSVPGEI